MKYTNHASLCMSLIFFVACASNSKADSQALRPALIPDVPSAPLSSAAASDSATLGAISGTYALVSFKETDESTETLCRALTDIGWSDSPSTFHIGDESYSDFNKSAKSLDHGMIGPQRCATTDKVSLAKGRLQSVHTESCTTLKTGALFLSTRSIADILVSGDLITYRMNSTSSNSDIEAPIHQECVFKLKR